MSSHRIARFLPVQTRLPLAVAAPACGFVALPACFMQTMEAPVDLFEQAYLAAKQQVAERRESRLRAAYQWN